MKKRRTLIISLLLVAALALGIGYASFASEMMINGEAKLNATDSKVVFTDATPLTGTTDGVTVSPTGLSTKSLTLDVAGFLNAGDTAVVQVTISNPHDFDVSISDYTNVTGIDRVNADGTPYFSITASDEIDNDVVIPAGEDLTFTLTFVCNATSASVVNENFTITFKANAV